MTNQVRGGFGAASVGGGGVNVGRGQVVAATNARIASAGDGLRPGPGLGSGGRRQALRHP